MTSMCSIIIPTYNTRELTLACLEDLTSHPPALPHEILVVDNNSNDGTAAEVRQKFPQLTLIANPSNEGFGRALNIGARLARGKTLCFLNSDTLGVGKALTPLHEWLNSHPETALVAPRFTRPDGSIQQMSWGWNPVLWGELIQQYFAPYALRESRWKTWLATRLQSRSRSVDIVCGACMVIRRKMFDRIQGFDPEFELYFEDSDLSLRVRQAGGEVHFCSEAQVIHHLGQSSRGSWGLTPLVYRQSQIHYYRKHAPAWSLPLLKFYQCLKWFRILLVKFISPQERPRITRYLELFWNVIWEKEKLVLARNYFD